MEDVNKEEATKKVVDALRNRVERTSVFERPPGERVLYMPWASGDTDSGSPLSVLTGP